MTNQTTKLFVAGALLTLTASCEGPPPVKSQPTWEADVYPILQGQCLNCHGSEADRYGAGTRFDFFNLDNCSEVEFKQKPTIQAFPSYALAILTDVTPQQEVKDDKPVGPAERPKMPPLPASLIEDWQVETLKNWAKYETKDKEKARGSRGNRNRDPKIIITSQYPDKVGDELKVSYRFEDTDGDPVIGVLKFGDAKVDLLKLSGQVTLSGFTAQSGDTLTLTADICDGWGRVTTDLKDIEKE
ncbi:MAG: hypothetical protein SF187_14955 [Deltaproteobacteria bacterium]|nr:hypothetical protein [Deltaproteobacteria bacterium]